MQRVLRRNDSKRRVAVLIITVILVFVFSLDGVASPKNTKAASKQMISFSLESGYYSEPCDLGLVSNEGNKIYYTMDGSNPVVGEATTMEYTMPIRIESNKGKEAVLTTDSNSRKYVENGFVYTPNTDSLDRATIIRAISVDAEGESSPISTRTYFIGNDIVNQYNHCAVISLVTDPKNLLDEDNGIYVNGTKYAQTRNIDDANYMQHGDEWERSGYMEFFNGANAASISQGVGIRIHGGYSRRNPQKSLNLYFRADYDYGTKNLSGFELIPDTYALYDNEKGSIHKVTDKYKNIMLRNGGNDADYTKFQDAFIQKMVSDKTFTTQGCRPCMLYLNGEFWGLYNLTEKYSDKYLEEKFDVDNHNVIVYKELELDEGEDPDGANLRELMDLGNLDMSDPSNFQRFKDIVDYQSFLEYYATEIYINNNDWWSGCNAETPHNNIEFWKVADVNTEIARGGANNPYADGKWRYMLYDTEWSMGLYNSPQAGAAYDSIKYHAIGQPDPSDFSDAGRTEANGDPVFAAVLKNEEFRRDFTNALLDIRNWNFEYSRCEKVLNEFASIYTPLMNSNRLRWNTGNVSGRVNEIKNFLAQRPDYMLSILEDNMEELSSADRVQVNVKNNMNLQNAIQVNTIVPDTQSGFHGVYYKDYPMELTASDQFGLIFDHWEVTGATVSDRNSKKITVTLEDSNVSIEAIYTDGTQPSVITPTPTETPSPTVSPTPTENPSPMPTKTPSPTPTETPSPTVSPTPTQSPSPTVTLVPTITSEPTNSPSNPNPPSDSNPPSAQGSSGIASPTVTPAVSPVTDSEKDSETANDTMFVAKATVGLNSIKLTYNAVADAQGYIIYGAPCGANLKCKKLSTIKDLAFIQKNIEKDTRYKYYVVAYKKVNGKTVRIAKTPVIYVTTVSSAYTNVKAIRSAEHTLTLELGNRCMISSKVNKVNKSKKLVAYTAFIRYYSTDDGIAAVDAEGTIIAKKAGTCYIYCVAHNGIAEKIKVTVKK